MLYILATPIGNLSDVSHRALEVLRSVDILACEDTRRTRILLTHYEIPRHRTTISYREQTERRAGQRLISLLEEGHDVVLCSDGGYPGISDPGYRLIAAAIEHNIEIQILPGASAPTVALLLSGLPTSSSTFKGYPPRKAGQLRRFFSDEGSLPHTLILFESPFRVAASLAAALEVLGNRRAAVCIELTKKFENVHRGFLSDLLEHFTDRKVKGEVTIVIAGNNPKFTAPDPNQQQDD